MSEKKKMLCFEIDETKHREVRIQALKEGKTMVDFMNGVVDEYLERKKNE